MSLIRIADVNGITSFINPDSITIITPHVDGDWYVVLENGSITCHIDSKALTRILGKHLDSFTTIELDNLKNNSINVLRELEKKNTDWN